MSLSKEEKPEEKPEEGKRIIVDPSRPPVEGITPEQLEKSREEDTPSFIEKRIP